MINTLSLYYQNVRGLRTKTHTFKRNLQLTDVIGIMPSRVNLWEAASCLQYGENSLR